MPSHLTWPLRLAAFAAGVFVALTLAAPLAAARWTALGWGVGSVLALASTLALFASDGALARRLGPRSRRAAWSARLALCAAIALAAAHSVAAVLAGALAGAGLGLIAREARATLTRDLVLACLAGGATAGAVLTLASPPVALALALTSLVLWALAALVASFRGGPGRPPARPSDVVWLYALGTALAVVMGLR